MGPVAYFSLCLLGCLIFNPWLEGTGALSCPPDWLLYGTHCYGFFHEKESWSDAEEQCHNTPYSTQLATILTREEGNAVAAYISESGSESNVWIGLHDSLQNGAWKMGEPNNESGSKFCTELSKDKGFQEWNVKHCDTKNAYVCKL